MRTFIISLILIMSPLMAGTVFGMPLDTAVTTSASAVEAEKVVTDVKSDLKISGVLPTISVPANLKFQNELNALILKDLNDKVSLAAKDNAKSIVFSYDVKPPYGDYYSIITRSVTSLMSTREDVTTYVFSTKDYKLLSIKDVLGVNGTKIINRVINDEMSKKPGVYVADFKGVSETQSFYIESGSLFVVFNKFAIGPASLGTPEFSVNIALAGAYSFTIGKTDYRITEPYNLKMIPLRTVCEGLGFEVDWDVRTKSVAITRKSGFSSTVTIGRNSYSSSSKNRNQTQPRTLESAPELFEDKTTLLPISYFELILDACYTVDSSGSITFSFYPLP